MSGQEERGGGWTYMKDRRMGRKRYTAIADQPIKYVSRDRISLLYISLS